MTYDESDYVNSIRYEDIISTYCTFTPSSIVFNMKMIILNSYYIVQGVTVFNIQLKTVF